MTEAPFQVSEDQDALDVTRPSQENSSAPLPGQQKEPSIETRQFTSVPPRPEETTKNSRFAGRNLITWNRKNPPSPIA